MQQVVAVSMLYSGGIPILYLLAAFSFAVSFVIDKVRGSPDAYHPGEPNWRSSNQSNRRLPLKPARQRQSRWGLIT